MGKHHVVELHLLHHHVVVVEEVGHVGSLHEGVERHVWSLLRLF